MGGERVVTRGEGVSCWETSSKSSWTKKVEPPDEREQSEGEIEDDMGEGGRGRREGSADSGPVSKASTVGGEKGAGEDPGREEENLREGVTAATLPCCPSWVFGRQYEEIRDQRLPIPLGCSKLSGDGGEEARMEGDVEGEESCAGV